MLLAKKDSDEQVLLAEDQAWMESSSDSDQEINANMVFMAQIENVLSDSDASSSSAEETIAEVNKRSRKGQNQIKTGQKREVWRSWEKVKAVTMDKGRKTEDNAKRMVKNARTVKKLFKFKEKKKRQGLKVQFLQSSSRGAQTVK
nr:hypothetical protein [Tanacetum cinerariifolium]